MSGPTIDEIERVTLQNRAAGIIDRFGETNALLSRLLYADDRKYSRWELFVMRMQRRRERIHDAWLVLTGRADIGY